MQILDLLTPSGDISYYEEDFLNILDSHMTYFKKLKNTIVVTLDPQLVYKHEGDLTGLLDEMNYGKRYHYAIMRINDLRSTNELRLGQVTLIIPDFAEIDLLNSIYRTKKFNI